MVQVLSFSPPPIRTDEVLRYAGMRGGDPTQVQDLLADCIALAEPLLSYRVCYRVTAVATLFPEHRPTALLGCEKMVIFAATIGAGIDRLIAKYNRLSPAKALLLQAIGAERVESLCDVFCAQFAQTIRSAGERVGTRFSPGYGSVALALQPAVLSLLDCPRSIGITLGASLLMSPSKSVTAIMGISPDDCHWEETR